jgi:hypothetical protein
MFCALGLIFEGTEGVGFRFQVLRSRTRYQWYRGHQGFFSCFTIPNSFWALPRPPGPVFMFCAPGLVSSGTEGGYRFQVLRSRNRFPRYRGRRGSFSCFALPNTFLAISRASRIVFMFYAHVIFFGGIEGHQVPFSLFALPDSLRAVPSASGTVFKFCAPELIFDSTEGVGAYFHVLRSRTLIGQYRGRRGSFPSFALTDSFWAVPRPSDPFFLLCAPRLVFDSTEAVGA